MERHRPSESRHRELENVQDWLGARVVGRVLRLIYALLVVLILIGVQAIGLRHQQSRVGSARFPSAAVGAPEQSARQSPQ